MEVAGVIVRRGGGSKVWFTLVSWPENGQLELFGMEVAAQ
jgi:hypothetical protein